MELQAQQAAQLPQQLPQQPLLSAALPNPPSPAPTPAGVATGCCWGARPPGMPAATPAWPALLRWRRRWSRRLHGRCWRKQVGVGAHAAGSLVRHTCSKHGWAGHCLGSGEDGTSCNTIVCVDRRAFHCPCTARAHYAGVQVDPRSARYHSSQPWPFPQSLMIGFTAEAAPAADATGPGAADAPPRRGLNLLAGPGAVAACDVGLLPSEADRYLLPRLPTIQVRTVHA